LRKIREPQSIAKTHPTCCALPSPPPSLRPDRTGQKFFVMVPGAVQTVSGAATSVTAFLRTAARGDMLKTVRVVSPADFDREFGGMVTGKELGGSIRQFFLNGGSDAWVVRIPNNPGDADWRAGLSALDAVFEFSLRCSLV